MTFEFTYEKYFDEIYRYCYYRTDGDRYCSEEATAETFFLVVKQWETVKDFNEDRLRAWLYGVARNKIKEVRREQKTSTESLSEERCRALIDEENIHIFTGNNVLGRGISGQTTSHMLVRFRRDVIDFSPEYVVILAGTNDVARNNGEISLDNVLGNLISMCELAEANRIKPILCAVLPADGFWWRTEIRPAEDLVRLNSMIKEYARSAKIPFVDFHTPFKDENGGLPKAYADDGVHPNLHCYKIMEDIILDYIK